MVYGVRGLVLAPVPLHVQRRDVIVLRAIKRFQSFKKQKRFQSSTSLKKSWAKMSLREEAKVFPIKYATEIPNQAFGTLWHAWESL